MIRTELWTDPKVKRLSADEKLLLLYCITSGHGHLSGLYVLPIDLAAFETGLSTRRIKALLVGSTMAPLVAFDPACSVVWVRSMLTHQGSGSKIATAVIEQVRTLRGSTIAAEFIARYATIVPGLADAVSDGVPDGACGGAFCQEKEKEQEKEDERANAPGAGAREPQPIASGNRASAPASRASRNGSSTQVAAPTRQLIDVWIGERARLGFGPEAKLGRHANVFTDLWQRLNRDTPAAEAAVRCFFALDHDLIRKNGPSIGTFAAVMDRLVAEVARRPASDTLPPPRVAPISEDEARAREREELRAIKASRERQLAGETDHD